MARDINKVNMIKNLVGMNPLVQDKGAKLAKGPDNVPAVITDQQGTPKGPAMIKEGEFVISVPAIVGAGKGNYDKGLAFFEELHKRLQRIGEELLKQQSLSGMQ